MVIVSAQVQSQVNCYRINSNSKAPGVDGVMAKHVLYSHKSISLHLLILFTAIIVHKYVSSEFGIGRTVPLLKTNL